MCIWSHIWIWNLKIALLSWHKLIWVIQTQTGKSCLPPNIASSPSKGLQICKNTKENITTLRLTLPVVTGLESMFPYWINRRPIMVCLETCTSPQGTHYALEQAESFAAKSSILGHSILHTWLDLTCFFWASGCQLEGEEVDNWVVELALVWHIVKKKLFHCELGRKKKTKQTKLCVYSKMKLKKY